jgi:broad specificity phosphatase PhoE
MGSYDTLPRKVASMEPTIYLIRHESTGLNDGAKKRLRGWRDVPLDEPGLKDLPKLANFFTGHQIKHVIAADLSRHTDTGLAIARKQKTTFTPTASFRPWDNTDAWGDRELNKALYREMGHYVDNPDQPLPGGKGETFGTFSRRHDDGIDKVAQYAIEHPNEPIAVITSTRGIGQTLYHFTGEKKHIAGHDAVAPGGVIKLTFDGKKWNAQPIRKDLSGTNSRVGIP